MAHIIAIIEPVFFGYDAEDWPVYWYDHPDPYSEELNYAEEGEEMMGMVVRNGMWALI